MTTLERIPSGVAAQSSEQVALRPHPYEFYLYGEL
jgi:hypothetical protein